MGVGGSPRPGSTAEQALRVVLTAAERLGAEVRLLGVRLLGGAELMMPLHDPAREALAPNARRLPAEPAAADGVVLATPACHGSISGLVKNALDHIEELRDDARPCLSGRAVGRLAVAHGRQGAVSALAALRDVTHALRGRPTPLGAAVNTTTTRFGPGVRMDPQVRSRLETVAEQVVGFARLHAAAPAGHVEQGAPG
jgi:FMN reductase